RCSPSPQPCSSRPAAPRRTMPRQAAATVPVRAAGRRRPQAAAWRCGRRASPADVGVVTVRPHAVGLVTELPGRLEASRVAQVRARVPGILLKRVFVEGSDVKAGQLLFLSDSAPLQSQVAAAQAQIARAQANLSQAAAQAERYKPL